MCSDLLEVLANRTGISSLNPTLDWICALTTEPTPRAVQIVES